MKQKIFLWIGIVLLTIFWFAIYKEFMVNHTYYYDMFNNRQNRKVILLGVFSLLFPLWYILQTKKFSLKNLIVKRLPAGLLFFGLGQIIIKWEWVGQTWLIMFIINTLFLYFLGVYLILWLTSIWKIINKYWIKLENKRIQELFLNFWIWLWVFLLLIKIIASVGILYGAISRLVFIWFWVAIYFSRKDLWGYKALIEDIFSWLSLSSLKSDNLLRIGLILLGISILYYFYGFNLAFIPYSTARDANHAYMYVPKVLAENHWVIRWNIGAAANSPQLRHSFITFRFSLIWSIKRFWLAPDTIAVAMNFLSAIFVLILGLWTVREVITYSTKKESKTRKITFYLGRFLILLRLTSGMGAFLVFVDNKTDLGVMAITMLWMLSWFIFLTTIKEHKHEKRDKYIKVYSYFGCFLRIWQQWQSKQLL
jgi:hypothetical protein